MLAVRGKGLRKLQNTVCVCTSEGRPCAEWLLCYAVIRPAVMGPRLWDHCLVPLCRCLPSHADQMGLISRTLGGAEETEDEFIRQPLDQTEQESCRVQIKQCFESGGWELGDVLHCLGAACCAVLGESSSDV